MKIDIHFIKEEIMVHSTTYRWCLLIADKDDYTLYFIGI